MALTLDPNPDNPLVGDIDIQDGQIHFWDKKQARRQKVTEILLFVKGSWFANPDEGIPWFQQIIGSRRKDVALSIIRKAFQTGLPDLSKVLTLNGVLDPVTRSFAVTYELLFDDGIVLNSADFAPLVLT